MTWFTLDAHCTVCQGKCLWSDHTQIKKRQKFKTERETYTNETLKQRYMQDMHVAIEVGKKTCEDKIVSAYKRLLEGYQEIQQCINYINKYSLHKNSISLKDFIQDLIASEEEVKEDGYQQRIRCYKRLEKMKDEDTPADEVQQAVSFIQSLEISEP